jgi:hypothetical protein
MIVVAFEVLHVPFNIPFDRPLLTTSARQRLVGG